MCRTSVGTRLYVSVLSVFVVFAVAFIIFQHAREREYKISALNTRLQDYNERMIESMGYLDSKSDKSLDRYVANHYIHGLRVTLINRNGKVIYDNVYKTTIRWATIFRAWRSERHSKTAAATTSAVLAALLIKIISILPLIHLSALS